MNKFQKISLFLLRIGLGWICLWAGWSHLTSPNFSAAGYLNSAKAFPALFHWFASPGLLPLTNMVVTWGLLVIGASLILGLYVRYTAWLAVAFMILFYLPLGFPYPNVNSFIVDEHLIYAAGFLVLAAFNSDKYWSVMRHRGR